MKFGIEDFKKKARQGLESIDRAVSGSKNFVDSASKRVSDSAESTRRAIDEATEVTRSIAQRTLEHERVQEFVKTATEVADTAKSEFGRITNKAVGDSGEAAVGAPEQLDESDKLVNAIRKLKGKDKVGVAGESLSAVGGAAAGVAASGAIASAAGASTLFGSTTLASTLGGIFVTTTPVGWVIGSAFVAGAAGYGISRIIRSGSKQDQLRKEMVERLNERLRAIQSKNEGDGILVELNQVLTVTVVAGVISEERADKMLMFIEKGTMAPEVALERVKAIALSAGVIEPVSDA
jgi:hypothetical protein